MGRYQAYYDKNGLLAEYEDGVLLFHREGGKLEDNFKSPQIVKDIEPYRNMINGQMITSRSQHRNLLRDHNCVEIGNDTSHMDRPKPPPVSQRRESLHRMLGDVSDKQIRQIVTNELKARR
tara:strand:- start:14827 stop:15189 length:363 start_codon:yes stop_codon:yes gene_type:complete